MTLWRKLACGRKSRPVSLPINLHTRSAFETGEADRIKSIEAEDQASENPLLQLMNLSLPLKPDLRSQ